MLITEQHVLSQHRLAITPSSDLGLNVATYPTAPKFFFFSELK